MTEPMLTEQAAAKRLERKPKTLRNWRSAGLGPPFVRYGRSVYYPQAGLDAWQKANLGDPPAVAATPEAA